MIAPAPALAQWTSRIGSEREKLLEIIKDKSLMKGKGFVLSSGVSSSYFFDMKKTMFDPEGANLITNQIHKIIKNEQVDAIGGQVIGAVPIVSLVCAKSFETNRLIPAFIVRKELKGHGTNQLIDGNLPKNARHVILVDDVTTTGASVLTAVDAVTAAGCQVSKIITIVDREEGAGEKMQSRGLSFVALYTRSDFD